MRRILLLIMIVLPALLVAQEFELTPEGLVDAEDASKDYIVLTFENKSAEELYSASEMYFNTIYNNPDFVSSKIKDKQFAINAVNPRAVKLKGTAKFDISYSLILEFKDGKIKFNMLIKRFERTVAGKYEKWHVKGTNLGILGKTVIFNNEGDLVTKKGKESTEKYVNQFINEIREGILKYSIEEEW